MGAVQEKTWFSRNWKWFVPLVSLGVVTLSLGFCTATMFGLFGMMKTSGAYKQALQRAAGHPGGAGAGFSREAGAVRRRFPAGERFFRYG